MGVGAGTLVAVGVGVTAGVSAGHVEVQHGGHGGMPGVVGP